jgi:hypothetical protein
MLHALKLEVKYILIISTFAFFTSKGQTNASFVFYDACEEAVVELPFEIWKVKIDTTIQIDVRQSIQLEQGYYQVQVDMNWNEMRTTFWFDIYTNNEPTRTDTLFLQKTRFYGPTYLHAPPEEFKHYYCKNLCEGTIEEVDSNGITRFKGRFMNGRPTSNLKYYNSSGKRTRTEIYVDGQLERIK